MPYGQATMRNTRHLSSFPFPATRAGLLAFLLGNVAYGAPVKVAVLSDSEALKGALDGVTTTVPTDQAEVLIVNRAAVDRAVVEAAAKRGAGIIVIGDGIKAGEWLKPLAGGTWTANSHEFASEMMFYPVTDGSPLTKDAYSFDLKDETLYDLDLEPTITVLGSAFTPKANGGRRNRGESEGLERANVYDVQPQMWSYQAEDGHRSMVLLQGAEDSLEHASVRTFILRGISWAAKRENPDELSRAEDLDVLRYPAGGPRRAEETVKSFDLEPGFTASAIASEPLINKPIAMQWDAKGRLWIAETPEYPNGRRELVEPAWKESGVLKPGNYDRPATDRISYLEDTNGDGMMDKKTVFYTGLELVTGFCLYQDGVIAVGQPDIVFVHGEGAEQKVERLFTGFTPGDTHFVANHFMVGPDGWVYANTGSDADAVSITHPDVKGRVVPGIFRFKPDGSAIEQVGSKGGNAFGLEITSKGEMYFGQATSGNPVQHLVLPEWVLAKGKVGNVGSIETVIQQRKVIRPDMPQRVPYMQIDVVGGYSAACASTVQEGGAWPSEWNDTIWCSEPILDIIHVEKLKPKGVNIIGEPVESQREFLRSKDFWFFPVDIQFGPDGAMYILDFYNPIVAHSDTRGPKHSRAGASVRPDRDHFFGRIYRIQSDAAKKLEAVDLSKADAAGLVKAFTHPNKLIRFNAQRLLMERKDAAKVVPALVSLAESNQATEARSLALWSLQRLNKLPAATLQKALESKDVNMRRCALLVVEALGEKNTADVSPLLNDTDVRTRLFALRAMASSPINPKAANELLAILPKLEDDWSRSAATAAASSNAESILLATIENPQTPGEALLDLAGSLAHQLSDKGDGKGLADVVIALSKAPPGPLAVTTLEAAGKKIPDTTADPGALILALKALLDSPDKTLAASTLPFAVAWDKNGTLKAKIDSTIQSLLTLSADSKQSDATRGAAVRALVNSRQANPAVIGTLAGLLRTSLSQTLTADIIKALASSGDSALGRPLIAVLANLPTTGQTLLFDTLTTRADWSNALLDALQTKELPATLLGPSRISRLRLHPDPAVAKRAQAVIEEVGAGTNPAKDETIAKLLPEIEGKPGDAAAGKALFAGACGICHMLNNEGHEVGPTLDGIGVHGTRELLTHIIDPSRVVDNEHRTWSIAMKNGSFAVGIISRENERMLTLKLPGGATQDIAVADVISRQDTGLSLMPEGFESLGTDSLANLLAYMRGGSQKYRALELGGTFTTNTGGGLYARRDAENDTVQPSKYGVVTVEGVPFALPDPNTTPSGGNVIVLKPGDGDSYASGMPQRVEIPVGYPAGNLHFLGGVAGWGGGPDVHKPAMKVTILHTDGKTQVEELDSGDVFLDYTSGDEVPGSKRVRGITRRTHVRYFSLPVNDRSPIQSVVLESYGNGMAPTTLAITTDNEPPEPRKTYEPEPRRRRNRD